MSLQNLTLSLVAIGILLAIIGTLYGYKVYKWPMKRTWIEVVIGCGYTLFGVFLAQAAVLEYYNLLWELGWILVLPVTGFIITGLAMIAFQEYKRLVQHYKSENALLKYQGRD
jgi:H+/Cl- antiporter ClcA